MEKKCNIIACLKVFPLICILGFVGIVIISCDALNETDIEIINESSNDLIIEFLLRNGKFCHHPGYDKIELKKNESIWLLVYCLIGPNIAPIPNDDVIKIVFSDFETTEIIKVLNNNNHFKSIDGSSSTHGKYRLIITDELFQ